MSGSSETYASSNKKRHRRFPLLVVNVNDIWLREDPKKDAAEKPHPKHNSRTRAWRRHRAPLSSLIDILSVGILLATICGIGSSRSVHHRGNNDRAVEQMAPQLHGKAVSKRSAGQPINGETILENVIRTCHERIPRYRVTLHCAGRQRAQLGQFSDELITKLESSERFKQHCKNLFPFPYDVELSASQWANLNPDAAQDVDGC